MSNVIAVVWDFDKTLIKGYMQEPIFNDNKVDPKKFWNEVNMLPSIYEKQKIKVNAETIYLNHFIKYAQEGKFRNLTNKKLFEYGSQLNYYPGVDSFFKGLKNVVNDTSYTEYGIRVENYVISTGMAEIIRGSKIARYVDGIWGCELIGDEETGIIREVGYTIDNTTKTRALFEINKGVGKIENASVNMQMPEEYRRVHFKNMIYVADGPSDIPAFSVVNQYGGATFAVYPKGDTVAFNQVEELRKNKRVNMFAEADYRKGKTAYMWITGKIMEFAERIRQEERERLEKGVSFNIPKHIS